MNLRHIIRVAAGGAGARLGLCCTAGVLFALLLPLRASANPIGPEEIIPGAFAKLFWIEAIPIVAEAIAIGLLLGIRWHKVLAPSIIANSASLLFGAIALSMIFIPSPIGMLMLLLIGGALLEGLIYAWMLGRKAGFSRSFSVATVVCLVSICIFLLTAAVLGFV